ncbi:T9SS type A sorting domain-containing protein, partial [Flavobacterium gilvum]|uniref:T9SS type A sorting domain-containing protein n=1 Tax=Flavobacterium gilvum TaxID=1492737 RepID=UPI0005514BBE
CYNSSDGTVQGVKDGTGSGLTWANVAAGTGYYAIATGAAPTNCTSAHSNAVSVVEVANPAALSLTGSSICTSVTGTGTITSSTSVIGVKYQLYNSSDGTVQGVKDGTGSGLTWNNVAAGTGYYVVATNTTPITCTSQSNAVNVIETPNPAALVLTGHDFCSSTPNSGSITSSTSGNNTISYQLYNSLNTIVQEAKPGISAALTWSGLSAGTGYYVIATGATPTSCTATSNTANVVQNPNPILHITTPEDLCAPGVLDFTVVATANAITAGSELPEGTILSYHKNNNGSIGNQMTKEELKAVSAGTYWVKATTPEGCTDTESITITVKNCGGLIYPTATTCTSFLNNQPPLDKICYTVTKKGAKTTISNATPGVFFYYAKIVAPSTGPLTIEVLQFNNSRPHVKDFAIQLDQVFVFDNNCTKIATGKEVTPPKGSGQAKVTIPNAIAGRTYVISVKYDTKTIIGQTTPSVDYHEYFISRITSGVNTYIDNTTAGDILVSNCSAPTPLTTVAKTVETGTVETITPTDTTTTSKIKADDFTAYPVPFKDQLTIRYNFDYPTDVKIEVFNAKGNLVITKYDTNGYLNKEISLNLTSTGQEEVYIVKVTTNKGSSVQKVISSR